MSVYAYVPLCAHFSLSLSFIRFNVNDRKSEKKKERAEATKQASKKHAGRLQCMENYQQPYKVWRNVRSLSTASLLYIVFSLSTLFYWCCKCLPALFVCFVAIAVVCVLFWVINYYFSINFFIFYILYSLNWYINRFGVHECERKPFCFLLLSFVYFLIDSKKKSYIRYTTAHMWLTISSHLT